MKYRKGKLGLTDFMKNKSNTDLVSGAANNVSGIISSVDANNQNTGATIASSALSGLSMGMQTGNPYVAAGGAVVGGLYGLFTAQENKRKAFSSMINRDDNNKTLSANNTAMNYNNNPSLLGDKNASYYAGGGMIKRADGSYSKRGLWDNVRANKGSGKKPTSQMLKQERKINKMAFGGEIPTDATAVSKKYINPLDKQRINNNLLQSKVDANKTFLSAKTSDTNPLVRKIGLKRESDEKINAKQDILNGISLLAAPIPVIGGIINTGNAIAQGVTDAYQGEYGNALASAVPYGLGKLPASKLGAKFLPNAYKLNPFAKGNTLNKFDKNTFLRQVDEETYKEGLESGVIKGKQNVDISSGENTINIKKAFGDDAYYRKGQPYYANEAKYPYMYGVKKGEEAFIPKVNGRIKKFNTGNTDVRVSKSPISTDEADVYKHNWLNGYEKQNVPTTLSKVENNASIKSAFSNVSELPNKALNMVETVGKKIEELPNRLSSSYNKKADKALEEANQWSKEWYSHPETLKRTKEVNPHWGEQVLNEGLEQGRYISSFESNKNQLKNFVDGKKRLHKGNLGISGWNLDTALPKDKRVNMVNKYYGTDHIKSTAIHESNHGMTEGEAYLTPHMKATLKDNYERHPDIPDIVKKPTTPEEVRFDNYIKEPTETYARMMEIRLEHDLKPGQIVDNKMIDKIMDKGLKGKSTVEKRFYDLIPNKYQLQHTLNYFPSATPVVGAGLMFNQYNKKAFGGSLFDKPKIDAKDAIGNTYSKTRDPNIYNRSDGKKMSYNKDVRKFIPVREENTDYPNIMNNLQDFVSPERRKLIDKYTTKNELSEHGSPLYMSAKVKNPDLLYGLDVVSGSPKITLNGKRRASFDTNQNNIFLPKKIESNWSKAYLPELAHSYQYSKGVKNYRGIPTESEESISSSDKVSKEYEKEYSKKGSVENQAHSEIDNDFSNIVYQDRTKDDNVMKYYNKIRDTRREDITKQVLPTTDEELELPMSLNQDMFPSKVLKDRSDWIKASRADGERHKWYERPFNTMHPLTKKVKLSDLKPLDTSKNQEKWYEKSLFAMGGSLNLYNTKAIGGKIHQLTKDDSYVQGQSHDEGGVKFPEHNVELEGGETMNNNFVFSKQLGFADKHLSLIKQKQKFEGLAKVRINDKSLINSIQFTDKKIEGLKQEQENFKAQLGLENDSDEMARGGTLFTKDDLLKTSFADSDIPTAEIREYQMSKRKDESNLSFTGSQNMMQSHSDNAPKSGSIALSHNNPRNIKFGAFAKQFGAIEGRKATDGGSFAYFPSVESGLEAGKSLFKGKGYKDLSVDSALRKWSNNGYGDNIAPELRGKKVKDLSDGELNELTKRQIKAEDGNMYKKLYGKMAMGGLLSMKLGGLTPDEERTKKLQAQFYRNPDNRDYKILEKRRQEQAVRERKVEIQKENKLRNNFSFGAKPFVSSTSPVTTNSLSNFGNTQKNDEVINKDNNLRNFKINRQKILSRVDKVRKQDATIKNDTESVNNNKLIDFKNNREKILAAVNKTRTNSDNEKSNNPFSGMGDYMSEKLSNTNIGSKFDNIDIPNPFSNGFKKLKDTYNNPNTHSIGSFVKNYLNDDKKETIAKKSLVNDGSITRPEINESVAYNPSKSVIASKKIVARNNNSFSRAKTLSNVSNNADVSKTPTLNNDFSNIGKQSQTTYDNEKYYGLNTKSTIDLANQRKGQAKMLTDEELKGTSPVSTSFFDKGKLLDGINTFGSDVIGLARKYPDVPNPILDSNIRLQKQNANAEYTQANQDMNNALIGTGSLSASVGAGLRANLMATKMKANNEIGQRLNQTNTDIANRETLTNASINQNNNRQLNQFNEDVVDRNYAIGNNRQEYISNISSKMLQQSQDKKKDDLDVLKLGIYSSMVDKGVRDKVNSSIGLSGEQIIKNKKQLGIQRFGGKIKL